MMSYTNAITRPPVPNMKQRLLRYLSLILLVLCIAGCSASYWADGLSGRCGVNAYGCSIAVGNGILRITAIANARMHGVWLWACKDISLAAELDRVEGTAFEYGEGHGSGIDIRYLDASFFLVIPLLAIVSFVVWVTTSQKWADIRRRDDEASKMGRR